MKLSDLKITIRCPRCQHLLTAPYKMPCYDCNQIDSKSRKPNRFLAREEKEYK